jgi:hypothetical protein
MKRWKAIGPGLPGGVACAEAAEPATTAKARTLRRRPEMRTVRVIGSSL